MRVVKEMLIKEIRVTVFSWNNKYLIKFEQGMIEQTFKVNETDVGIEEDLAVFYSDPFLLGIQRRFDEMHQSLREELGKI